MAKNEAAVNLEGLPGEKIPKRSSANILRRIARIWSGVVILVGLLIFIGEVSQSRAPNLTTYPIYENLIPLALFISLVGLLLAWRWEGIGGLITIAGVGVANLVYWFTGREAPLVVFLVLLPVLIPGLLFLVSWRMHKPSSDA